MEDRVWISTDDIGRGLKLEGRFYKASSESGQSGGVVICHPHPLYGGDMDNGVVIAIQEAFAERGFSTLRFNFRGVGASEGGYDGGRGEVEDLLAACRFMRARGMKALYGAGYSFGSWILLKGCSVESFSGLVLVAPPLDILDFGGLKLPSSVPWLIIVGSRDEFCSQEKLRSWLEESSIKMNGSRNSVFLVNGDNHFLWRSISGVKEHIWMVLGLWPRESV